MIVYLPVCSRSAAIVTGFSAGRFLGDQKMEVSMQKKIKKVELITKHSQLKVRTGLKSGATCDVTIPCDSCINDQCKRSLVC